MKTQFVAMSVFEVVNDLENEVREAFIKRPKFVESWDGFVKLDVITPEENPKEFWLITYWKDADSYHKWYKSDNHKMSHDFLPKGLKLNPAKTKISYFTHIAE